MISSAKRLLDTCFISELRRPRIDDGVAQWVQSNAPADSFISVVTVMELESGAASAERTDPRRGMMLRLWLELVIATEFKRRTVNINPEIAIKAGRIVSATQLDPSDALIAATAIHHGLTVVTRNVRHFEPTGVSLVNPWAA